MSNVIHKYKLPNKECDEMIIDKLKKQKGIVLWGASYLGRKVGLFLKSKGIKVDCYWDKNASNVNEIDGVRVVRVFDNDSDKDKLIIICIGNNDIKNNLIKELDNKNYKNVLCGNDLDNLFAMALSVNKEEYIEEVDCKELSNLEKINKAIDYAIKSDNGVWKKQQEIIEWLRIVDNVVLFGMSEYHHGVRTFILDNGIKNIKYYSDFNSKKQRIDGLEYIEFDELGELDNVLVLVLNSEYDMISKVLDKGGIKYCPFKFINMRVYSPYYDSSWFEKQLESIISTLDLFDDEKSKEIYVEKLCNQIAPHLATKSFEDLMTEGEYFNAGLFELDEDEHFVDIGAFTGDSIGDFISVVNGKFGFIYGLELEQDNFNKLKANVNKMDIDINRVELFNLGASDENSQFAIEGNNVTAHIVKGEGNGKSVVKVVKLDDILKDRNITFIKMDIEGAEMAALKGAYEIISRNKPKLAISSYHYLQDLWEVPRFIKSINKEYKLYLRHHTKDVSDTDCYAY